MDPTDSSLVEAVGAGRHSAAIKVLDGQLTGNPTPALRLLLLMDRASCQAALGLSRKASKVAITVS